MVASVNAMAVLGRAELATPSTRRTGSPTRALIYERKAPRWRADAWPSRRAEWCFPAAEPQASNEISTTFPGSPPQGKLAAPRQPAISLVRRGRSWRSTGRRPGSSCLCQQRLAGPARRDSLLLDVPSVFLLRVRRSCRPGRDTPAACHLLETQGAAGPRSLAFPRPRCGFTEHRQGDGHALTGSRPVPANGLEGLNRQSADAPLPGAGPQPGPG